MTDRARKLVAEFSYYMHGFVRDAAVANVTIYHNKGVHWKDKVGPDTEEVPTEKISGIATRLCDFTVHIDFTDGSRHVEKWASRELMDRREQQLRTQIAIVNLQRRLQFLQGWM